MSYDTFSHLRYYKNNFLQQNAKFIIFFEICKKRFEKSIQSLTKTSNHKKLLVKLNAYWFVHFDSFLSIPVFLFRS